MRGFARRRNLEQSIGACSEAEKEQRRAQLAARESDYTRMRRVKLRESSFELLTQIGRGAFGEVWLVQLKGIGESLARVYFRFFVLNCTAHAHRNDARVCDEEDGQELRRQSRQSGAREGGARRVGGRRTCWPRSPNRACATSSPPSSGRSAKRRSTRSRRSSTCRAWQPTTMAS